MKTNKRWLRSILETSAQTDVALPWQRGPRRDEMIARRAGKPQARVPSRA